jgi:hypothetical protein
MLCRNGASGESGIKMKTMVFSLNWRQSPYWFRRNHMRSLIFAAAAGGLMLLVAVPARAGVQFPYYPVKDRGCSGESECLDLRWDAAFSWQMATEDDRRKCMSEDPTAGGGTGDARRHSK